ncbi:MAG: hypothetical protein NZ651_03460 [Candidatus Bipolaricaulota bacterium]|nr:hypothetical protein [Candidatus Bipolaricaulota bacterium]MDW8126812.1 hypothetical protein [Candidatus Bipolaricaulota bacterium]
MSRRWRSGQAGKPWTWLIIGAILLAGIGAIFGLRVWAISTTAREVRNLREKQNELWAEIEALKGAIQQAATPGVVEQKAREVLRWAYPDEELVILIRRR